MVRLKVWEWEYENWLDEMELGALSLDNYETAPECLDTPPRLREDIV